MSRYAIRYLDIQELQVLLNRVEVRTIRSGSLIPYYFPEWKGNVWSPKTIKYVSVLKQRGFWY